MLTFLLVVSATLSFTSAAIQWGNCSQALLPLATPKLQCASLSVPLNWTDPNSKNITIGLTRVRANDTANRKGTVIVNPGGPGQAASTLLAGQALGVAVFPPNLTTVFDIVGFDPRGVGPLSTAVTCDPSVFNSRVEYLPTTQSEYDAVLSANQRAWANCYNMTGDLLYNLDSLSVAKDIEALRVALDDGPLNFLGISYGTVLAQAYAHLHPTSFRTIAMDAVIDHNSSATAQFFDEAQSYESSLHRFAAWCNTTNTTICPLYGQDVLFIFNATVTNASHTPIPAPGCQGTTPNSIGGCYSNLTATEMLFTTQTLLQFKEPQFGVTPGWGGFAGALALAAQGNATAYAQAYAGAELASSANGSSSLFVGAAVPCLDDRISISSLSDITYRFSLGEYIAPYTRGISEKWNQQIRCLGFPIAPTYPQTDMSIDNTNNSTVLITQAKYDPIAAFVWAEQVRSSTANASLVLRVGDGHTSFFLGGETTDIVAQYFVSGEGPGQNVVVQS